MVTKRWVLGVTFGAAVAAAAALSSGCDGDDDRAAARRATRDPSAAATSRPAAVASSTKSGDQQPATTTKPRKQRPSKVPTFFAVSDGGQPQRMVEFPPAKLRLRPHGEGVLAVLYTDDPPAAASRDYRGNSYLFEMELTAEDAADLSKAQFRYHTEGGVSAAAGADGGETTNGIFLNGWQTHLEPADVVVVFEGQAPNLVATVAGQFRAIDEAADGAPRGAIVQGVLPVTLETDTDKAAD